MSRAVAVLLSTALPIALAAHVVACAGAPGNDSYDPPTEVQFTWDTVNPATVRITPNGIVTWTNTSEESRGFVVFPASIAASFSCGDLRPYFLKTGSSYQSQPLTTYDSERVKLPCPLKPGTYPYQIVLVGAAEDEISMEDPERTLQAVIIVE